MSYLASPRVNFSGLFQATPSTINNVPGNYDPCNWTTLSPALNGVAPVQLVWNPNGDGVFAFQDCTVSATVPATPSAVADPLVGKPVTSPSSPSPPKLVDLDPQQQGVSEIYGMRLQFGDASASVSGNYVPGPFDGMWGQTQGALAPRGSASASAIYQSTLTDLEWNVGDSPVLAQLQEAARASGKLSINFVVSAHNNSPETFAFDRATFLAMLLAGVPATVVDSLAALTRYSMDGVTLGVIPTESYVRLLLSNYLSAADVTTYAQTILDTSRQATSPLTPCPFGRGMVMGTVGPALPGEPTFMTPARMLRATAGSPCYDAPFAVNPAGTTLTLNLGNSLPTAIPGRVWDQSKLGALALARRDASGAYQVIAQIPYEDPSGFMTTRAGLLDIDVSGQDLAATPLALLSTRTTSSGSTTTAVLEEPGDGLYMRADAFVFRMNPDQPPEHPRGREATVRVHASIFGAKAAGQKVVLSSPPPDSPNFAFPGSAQGGIPSAAVTVTPADGAVTDADGVATFTITASDPGSPRACIDGQIYLLSYGDNGDAVSLQVYHPQLATRPITWDNCVRDILSKYAQLYPYMNGVIGDEATVRANAPGIRTVLQLPFEHPHHMPVTRDLSESRRALVIEWLDQVSPPQSAQ